MLRFCYCGSDQLTSVYLVVHCLYLDNVCFPKLLSGLMEWCFSSALDVDNSVHKIILNVMFSRCNERGRKLFAFQVNCDQEKNSLMRISKEENQPARVQRLLYKVFFFFKRCEVTKFWNFNK